MKTYIHARLGPADRARLKELKAATGRTESELVRLGLQLAAEKHQGPPNALALAGRSVGRFRNGPKDLSTHRRHLEGFGK